VRRGLFDFYLLHNFCETAYDFYTDEKLGVVEYLLAQKKAGRICHLGFSAWAETIEKYVPARLLKVNQRAFEAGRGLITEQGRVRA
jgi:predicted aldo/keto reductase-like oxidoreductase